MPTDTMTANGVGAGATERPWEFQARVKPWLLQCFGEAISNDKTERNHRFIEEALELVQACGCTQTEAHQLVDYVYGRSQGDVNQEVGGVMVTLAALCLANGFDMHAAGEVELARVWTKIDRIREKQATKPRNSPLPEYVASPQFPSYHPERDALLVEMEKALEPFASLAVDYGFDEDDESPLLEMDEHCIEARHCAKAYAVLTRLRATQAEGGLS